MKISIPVLLTKLKQKKPIILNLTNYVSMDFVANGLLAIGASPIMSTAQEEMEDLLTLASALVINIGTADRNFLELAEYTLRLANQLKKPVILDPVGAGATTFRTKSILNFLNNYKIDVISGNASEIMSLSRNDTPSHGVDSALNSLDCTETASQLAKKYKCCISVSGATDIIADATQLQQVANGSAIMSKVTGTGCLFSAIIAAFYATVADPFMATVAATVFYGDCGAKAALQTKAYGTFKTLFLDELSLT